MYEKHCIIHFRQQVYSWGDSKETYMWLYCNEHTAEVTQKRLICECTIYIVLYILCNEYTPDFGARFISFEEYIRCPSATSCSYGRICWDPKAEPSNFIRVPPSVLSSAPETGTLRSNHPNGNTSSVNRFFFFLGVLLLRRVGSPWDEGLCM